MSDQSIKLIADPYYSRTVKIGSIMYQVTVRWSELELAWYLDLKSTSTSDVDVRGIKLVGGVDLAEPYGMVDFGQMWLCDLTGKARDPEFDNIATDFILLFR